MCEVPIHYGPRSPEAEQSFISETTHVYSPLLVPIITIISHIKYYWRGDIANLVLFHTRMLLHSLTAVAHSHHPLQEHISFALQRVHTHIYAKQKSIRGEI